MANTIIIPGEPLGKQRPRASQINGITRIYTPKKTIDYETLIKLEYNQQCGVFHERETALCLKINCYYPIPQSFSKKKLNLCIIGKITPLVKPDIDNVAKVILDALNNIAYADDKQVVRLEILKQYGVQPRVEFALEAYHEIKK